ncbi:MAG: E3 binding domain-containing protein, partial [Planctomycetes bacterium]|nr:E3 binding domain-containing protein [Planctomycetota bacterium]
MFQFKLPDLGEGIHEGQVVSVLVKEGDTIAAYQPMLEIETDKASVEIPSPAAGVVKKLYAEPGQMVKVGEVLVEIDDGAAEAGGKPAAASEALKTAEAPRAAVEPAPAVPAAEAARAIESGAVATLAAPVRRDGPIPAAPAVRKLARELKVDLALVDPSGPRGRVVREDVERFSMGHRAAGAPAGRASTSTLPLEIPAAELPGAPR